MAARQPPSPAAHAPPRATPWRAPAYKPAQPASSEHGGGLAAAVLGSTRAASHNTLERAGLQATAQPASSKHGISLTAAVLGSPRAAPRRTAALASVWL